MSMLSPPWVTRLSALWPWLWLWLLVALLAIFAHGPVPLHSTRTLAVAWDMWAHHHWLVPYINGAPYSDKAPLLFWLIHAGWFAFGVSDVWPRVLVVLFGAAQLLLAATLARRLFPQRAWLTMATPLMLMALSYAFFFGLQIMYDVLLACWVLAALLCLTPTPSRAEPRWLPFALCLGMGLLTKGPVMLLHAVFPWLLGPLWNDWAKQHRGRWYGRGTLAVLLGLAILLAWAIPAGFSGGAAYRHRLFFTQTFDRVIKGMQSAEPLQTHARPLWWYLLLLPGLMFPFSGWPRAIAALVALRTPFESGLRFLLCWLLPVFVVLSLISGKQAYYPLPEFAGGVMLLAAAVTQLREKHPQLASTAWLGTWPLGVAGIGFALFLFILPNLVAANQLHAAGFERVATYSRPFSVAFLLLGLLLLVRGSGEVRRLAFAGLLGSLALNMLFTLTLWHKYDLAPVAAVLAQADAREQAIGNIGAYEGQFHFAGRLQRPVIELYGSQALQAFAAAHPDGLVVDHPDRLDAADRRYALLAQPFRSSWVVVWPASILAALRAGQRPQEPASATRIVDGAAADTETGSRVHFLRKGQSGSEPFLSSQTE